MILLIAALLQDPSEAVIDAVRKVLAGEAATLPDDIAVVEKAVKVAMRRAPPARAGSAGHRAAGAPGNKNGAWLVMLSKK